MSTQPQQNRAISKGDPDEIFGIIQPLGEGAFGMVYKAVDNRDGELVAVKIMPVEAEMGNMEREIYLLKSCHSPYIVNFRGAYIKDEMIWIAMEYCGAGSVLDLMKVTGKKLNEEQIQIVMRESLKGLEYLHSRRLVHRDIKAGNVLLNHRGNCKLADFGVAKDTALGDMATTTIGSPYWMAPEVFGKGAYDTKADIWSLGITAIEMATGRPPHSEKAFMQVVFLIPDPKTPSPNLPEEDMHWSDEFRDFVACCLQKNPAKRPSAYQLGQHPWIQKAKKISVLQKWVRNAMPLLDKWRQQQRMEDEANQQTLNVEDPDDPFKGGTAISPFTTVNQPIDINNEEDPNDGDPFNDGTMITGYPSDDEEKDIPPSDDAFDGGTMVRARTESEGTESENDFQGGTFQVAVGLQNNDEKSQLGQYMQRKRREDLGKQDLNGQSAPSNPHPNVHPNSHTNAHPNYQQHNGQRVQSAHSQQRQNYQYQQQPPPPPHRQHSNGSTGSNPPRRQISSGSSRNIKQKHKNRTFLPNNNRSTKPPVRNTPQQQPLSHHHSYPHRQQQQQQQQSPPQRQQISDHHSYSSQGRSRGSSQYRIVPKKREHPSKPLPPISNNNKYSNGRIASNNHMNNTSQQGQRHYTASSSSQQQQRQQGYPQRAMPSNPTNNAPPQTSNGRKIGSLFKGTDLLKVDFEIPSKADRKTLEDIKSKINDLYDADVTALEEFYDEQLSRINEQLQ